MVCFNIHFYFGEKNGEAKHKHFENNIYKKHDVFDVGDGAARCGCNIRENKSKVQKPAQKTQAD